MERGRLLKIKFDSSNCNNLTVELVPLLNVVMWILSIDTLLVDLEITIPILFTGLLAQ